MFDDEFALSSRPRTLWQEGPVHAHGADGVNLALRSGADSIERDCLIDAESLRCFDSPAPLRADPVDGERLSCPASGEPQRLYRRVREKIEWRIGITGEALRRAVPAA